MSKPIELIAGFVLPIGAYLYFLGWIYLYNFLNYFGIDILSVGFSVNDVFMYSFVPVRFVLEFPFNYPIGFFLLLVVLGDIWFLVKIIKSYHWSKSLQWAGAAIAVVSFFLGGFWVSGYAGQDRAAELRRTQTTRVHFIIDYGKEMGSFDFAFKKFNDEMKLRRIIESADVFYVFYQNFSESDYLEPAWVFKVPKEKVSIVESVILED